MMGMVYHRLNQKLTQEELAARTNLSRGRIIRMESDEPSGSYEAYERVAKVLCVSVDELLADVEGEKKKLRAKKVKMAEGEDLFNAISHYRLEHELPFAALAKILYCTGRDAKAACMAESSPEDIVEVLARALKITPGGFLTIYREGDLF